MTFNAASAPGEAARPLLGEALGEDLGEAFEGGDATPLAVLVLLPLEALGGFADVGLT